MNRAEHLLTILSEECNEIGQRASKALRFGATEMQPGQDLTNAQRIVAELIDLMAVTEMLIEEGVIVVPASTAAAKAAKRAKVERFLLYSAQCGTLTPNAN